MLVKNDKSNLEKMSAEQYLSHLEQIALVTIQNIIDDSVFTSLH